MMSLFTCSASDLTALDTCIGIVPSKASIMSLSVRWKGASYHLLSAMLTLVGVMSGDATGTEAGATARAAMDAGIGTSMVLPLEAASRP